MTRPPAFVNLAAECRAVEDGHLARLAPDGKALLVKSDTRPGVTYRVTVSGVNGFVHGTCDCPWGEHAPAGQGLGMATCKHLALACRRLVREGLARFDGERWVLTTRADPEPMSEEDVFRGLPR